jgi:hypothetical protein
VQRIPNNKVDGVNVVPEVYAVKNKISFYMKLFRVQEPVLLKRLQMLSIGGGSDLGPAMATLQFIKIISIFISFLMWMVTM